MKNWIFLLVGTVGCVITGVFLTVATEKLKIQEQSFTYSDAFVPQMFPDSLEESGYEIWQRIGYDNVGTAYYSGLSSYEAVYRIRPGDNDNLETLRKLGEILERRLQEKGVIGEGGLSVIINDSPKEVKFRYFYTIGPRVGNIRIYKLNDYFFYSHIESTNIRGPNTPES